MTFALATMRAIEFRTDFPRAFENTILLMNRLNEGNPKYRPYEVPEKEA